MSARCEFCEKAEPTCMVGTLSSPPTYALACQKCLHEQVLDQAERTDKSKIIYLPWPSVAAVSWMRDCRAVARAAGKEKDNE